MKREWPDHNEITWDVTHEDDADFVGGTRRKHTTILAPAWAGLATHAEETVLKVASEWFTYDEDWEFWFGDSQAARIRMRIYTPEAIAGDYLVDMRRVVEALRAKKLEPAA